MLTENGIRNLKKYCREAIENIKGYREAVEAVESEGRYICHHINELTFTRDQLKKMNMYYHRPASELIIMKQECHLKWHHKWNGVPMAGRTGEKNTNWRGEKASVSAIYKRAKNLYKAGKISEVDFQPYRDAWNEDRRYRRKHDA